MLLISREYPPFVGGGIGTYTVRMARALVGQGHQPVVVTVGDVDSPLVEESDGVRVVRVPFLGYVELQPDWAGPRPSILASPSGPACHAAFWAFHRESVLAMQLREQLPWLLETFKPRTIEAPDTGALLWFILNERRLGRGPLAELDKQSPPVIVHLHSPTAWIEELQGGPQQGRAGAELRSMERDVLRWADGITCPSHALAEWTQRWEPATEGRIRVVPYPLGEAVNLNAPLPNENAALFVGRMERRKGFDTLAEALGILGNLAPPLRVAGRDTFDWVSNEDFGATAITRHLRQEASKVHLLGELEPEALIEQRRHCSWAIIPSPNDNYPNTCMEAMAAGQIAIAANAGGMAEMIEDGVSGLLFTPGDANDLAHAIERATTMSDEQRSIMGRAARQRIAAVCDDAAIVTRRVDHAASNTPTLPIPVPEREVAVLAYADTSEEFRDPLTTVLRANNTIDAVAPWFARTGPDGREVIPFSTPSADHPELLVDHPGPIAIDASWWRRLETAAVGSDATSVLRALLEQGAAIAALPEVVAGPADPQADARPGTSTPQRLTDAERAVAHLQRELHPPQQATHGTRLQLDRAVHERDEARNELNELRASRAYKLARILSTLRRRLLG